MFESPTSSNQVNRNFACPPPARPWQKIILLNLFDWNENIHIYV